MIHKHSDHEADRRTYLSRDDREFHVDSDSWRLNKNVVISLRWVSELDSALADSVRMVLARFAQEYAATTVYGLNAECGAYIRKMGVSKFERDSLISFRSGLLQREEHRLATIRMFIRNWYEWGYPGVSKDVIELLDGWRLRGLEKGKAVRSLDPREGPLTDVEMTALVDGMLQAYMAGQINLENYALAAVLVYTGRRPIQITSLKIKDIGSRISDKSNDYWINFPRVKQRFSKWRSEFSEYHINEDLWSLLRLQARQVIDRVESSVGFSLGEGLKANLPLFPDYKVLGGCKEINHLLEVCLSDESHVERDYCNEVMSALEKKLEVYSERTGERLNLATRRFRYTLGSNIAREGKGELIIAEALDHSDTQNVGVYVKNLPDVVERIDKAVALQLAPLAQAFQGVLIESEAQAERGDDLHSRIGNGQVNVGNCGSYGFCGAMAPVACYTCKHFQPWVDGPHEIILEELLEKRDEVLANTKDIKVASSNDRLILAVAQVLRSCKAKKSERLHLEECDG